MWEGVGTLSQALTNGYGKTDDKFITAASAAGILASGLEFANKIAERCHR